MTDNASSGNYNNGFYAPFVGEVSRRSVKKWGRSPKVWALLVWGSAITVSGAIFFLGMFGLLKKALPKKSERDTWLEMDTQVMNALFILMCLIQHPLLFYHLLLLYRWTQEDIIRLRNTYCKNGTCKPQERAHMMVVVLLLHLNCFAQYALCVFYWGYRRRNRPAIGVIMCIIVAICATIVAVLYVIFSPLGKKCNSNSQAGDITDAEVLRSNDDSLKGKT